MVKGHQGITALRTSLAVAWVAKVLNVFPKSVASFLILIREHVAPGRTESEG